MNRRQFIGGLIGGVAATAAVRTWPFRVFSFPSEPRLLTMEEISEIYLRPAIENYVAMSMNGLWAVKFDGSLHRPSVAERSEFFKRPKNRIILPETVGLGEDCLLVNEKALPKYIPSYRQQRELARQIGVRT